MSHVLCTCVDAYLTIAGCHVTFMGWDLIIFAHCDSDFALHFFGRKNTKIFFFRAFVLLLLFDIVTILWCAGGH